MIPIPGRLKTVLVWRPVLMVLVLTTLWLTIGCGPQEPLLSPETQAFKLDIGSILGKMQQSLAEPTSQGNVQAIDKVLHYFAKTTTGMCVDCPYRLGVLNQKGDLLTTYPKNEIIGLNFSSYKHILTPLQKHKISQAQAFSGNGAKIYFIAAPVQKNNQVQGVIVLVLSPADLEKKWHLTEKEFLSIDFNTP
jgi:C4-dicarboxylate-specific signal transduction histidine kinase